MLIFFFFTALLNFFWPSLIYKKRVSLLAAAFSLQKNIRPEQLCNKHRIYFPFSRALTKDHTTVITMPKLTEAQLISSVRIGNLKSHTQFPAEQTYIAHPLWEYPIPAGEFHLTFGIDSVDTWSLCISPANDGKHTEL